MDWKTTDQPGYQPRSFWKEDQIPDLPCIRNAAETGAQPAGAGSAPEDDCSETLKTVLRAISPFEDARRAVLDAIGPLDPGRAA